MSPRAAALVTLSLFACRPAPHAAPGASAQADPAAKPGEVPAIAGLEPVDERSDPCDDFYQYACGSWLAAKAWPAEAPVWARSFSGAEALTRERLQALLGELAGASDPEQAKVGAYYRTCVDEPGRVAAGLAAIEPMLAAIEKLQPRELPTLLGTLHAQGVPALFWIRRPDASSPVLGIGVGSAGLGPVTMYAPKSPRLAAYGQHVAEMFRLAGLDEPQRRADAVVALEATLAELQPTMEELAAQQNKPPPPRPLAAVRKEAPTFAWDRYFAALAQPAPAQVQLAEGRFARLVALVKRTDPALLRDYLRWQLLHHTATILPPVFAAEHARMFDPEAAVAGREAGCVKLAERSFGPTLGRAYVERHVSAADRTRVRELVERTRTALRGEVERAAWIDAASRAKIFAYLDALAIEVAEPPATAQTAPISGDFLATSLALRKARIAAELAGTSARLLPVTAVNGQMSSGKVSLFAGIVQPPFYGPELAEPVVLGAIGQIVAHELGHVLDPEGVAQEIGLPPMPAYETRLQCVRDSYAAAEVAPGLHVNGEWVAKESFADNVGLRLAHALARPAGPVAERQFFVAWAQTLCTHYSPEMLALMTQADVAPAPLRTNQPLRLFPAFAAAFQCAEGTPMRPREACSPW